MVRYKLYGILSIFLFSFPKFFPLTSEREESSIQPKAIEATPISLKTAAKPAHASPKPIHVTASVYFPVESQTDSTPDITADGSKINLKRPRKHRWVAVSRNLLSKYGGKIDYGDTLKVKGISGELDGLYVVRDTMKRQLKNRIDILVGANDDIMGFWPNVKVYHLN